MIKETRTYDKVSQFHLLFRYLLCTPVLLVHTYVRLSFFKRVIIEKAGVLWSRHASDASENVWCA
jgi:hypothetical protein